MSNTITNQEALNERNLFLSPLIATNSPLLSYLPNAVCYRLNDIPGQDDGLLTFLQKIQKEMTTAGIPADKQGVAVMLCTNTDASKPYIHNKVTMMIVATAYEDDKTGRVTSIENYVSNNELTTTLTGATTLTKSNFSAAKTTEDNGDPFDPNAGNSLNKGSTWP
jgi:hypothetical protein